MFRPPERREWLRVRGVVSNDIVHNNARTELLHCSIPAKITTVLLVQGQSNPAL